MYKNQNEIIIIIFVGKFNYNTVLTIHEHALISVETILPNQMSRMLKNWIFNQWTVNYFMIYVIPSEICKLWMGISPSVVAGFYEYSSIFLATLVPVNKSQYVLPGTYWIIKNMYICRLSLALNTKDAKIFCQYDMIQVILVQRKQRWELSSIQ